MLSIYLLWVFWCSAGKSKAQFFVKRCRFFCRCEVSVRMAEVLFCWRVRISFSSVALVLSRKGPCAVEFLWDCLSKYIHSFSFSLASSIHDDGQGGSCGGMWPGWFWSLFRSSLFRSKGTVMLTHFVANTGFVVFQEEAEADAALTELDGHTVDTLVGAVRRQTAQKICWGRCCVWSD